MAKRLILASILLGIVIVMGSVGYVLIEEGITVVAIRKGEKYLFNPSEDELLEVGDAVILIGETKRMREIKAGSTGKR